MHPFVQVIYITPRSLLNKFVASDYSLKTHEEHEPNVIYQHLQVLGIVLCACQKACFCSQRSYSTSPSLTFSNSLKFIIFGQETYLRVDHHRRSN